MRVTMLRHTLKVPGPAQNIAGRGVGNYMAIHRIRQRRMDEMHTVFSALYPSGHSGYLLRCTPRDVGRARRLTLSVPWCEPFHSECTPGVERWNG